jgi:hypothetical protein
MGELRIKGIVSPLSFFRVVKNTSGRVRKLQENRDGTAEDSPFTT